MIDFTGKNLCSKLIRIIIVLLCFKTGSPETDYGLNMTETEYLGSPEIKGRRTE